METWESLFERAAAHDVSRERVEAALAELRGDREGADAR